MKAGLVVVGSRFGTLDVTPGRTSRLTEGLTGSALFLAEVGVDGVEGVVSLELRPVVVELCDRRCLEDKERVLDRFKVESPVLDAARVEVLAVRECETTRGFGAVVVEEAGARVDRDREGAVKADLVDAAAVDEED